MSKKNIKENNNWLYTSSSKSTDFPYVQSDNDYNTSIDSPLLKDQPYQQNNSIKTEDEDIIDEFFEGFFEECGSCNKTKSIFEQPINQVNTKNKDPEKIPTSDTELMNQEDNTQLQNYQGVGANNLQDPNQQQMYGANMGLDPMGMNQVPDQIENPEYIGRTYTLKKIYAKLISMDSYLQDSSDVLLLNLKKYVSQSIDLFQILIYNLRSFQNNIDDIVILYYKFLDIIYKILNEYYQKKNKEEKNKN